MSCNKFLCPDWCAIHAADSELSYGALQRLFRADCTDHSVLTSHLIPSCMNIPFSARLVSADMSAVTAEKHQEVAKRDETYYFDCVVFQVRMSLSDDAVSFPADI